MLSESGGGEKRRKGLNHDQRCVWRDGREGASPDPNLHLLSHLHINTDSRNNQQHTSSHTIAELVITAVIIMYHILRCPVLVSYLQPCQVGGAQAGSVSPEWRDARHDSHTQMDLPTQHTHIYYIHTYSHTHIEKNISRQRHTSVG